MIDVRNTTLDAEDREVLAHPLVGGVIFFTRNFESRAQIEALVREVREVRTPPLLIGVDHEGGRVQRFRKEFTVLPSMRQIGLGYEADPGAARRLAEQAGWLMGSELRASGFDLSFAPVVDLDYGVSNVIGDRSFHKDPRIVADLAIALMRGLRDAGMAAVAKHFPGHGAVIADSHLALPVDRRAYADMEDDLYPYRRLIENGLPAVMAAHVVYEAVDDKPAGFSPKWLQGELRGSLGFTGAIFSDDLSMEAAGFMGSVPQRAEAALAAGCDMVLICNNRPGALQTLDALRQWDEPVSKVRLARLHGVNMQSSSELRASAQWQVCVQAIMQCMERPVLKLNA
jgi:beta-N-acetylhexosaminidase